MTVEKAKKQRGKKNESLASKTRSNFAGIDNLIERIDKIEDEEQVSELFDQEQLLSESFKNLLNLVSIEASGEDEEENFDEMIEKVDINLFEMMEALLKDQMIEEEEFKDFFTIYEDFEGSDSHTEEEDIEDIKDIKDIKDIEEDIKKKNVKIVSKKSSKNLKELEMLMEKVEDESDLDEEEYETEDDEEDQDQEDISDEEDLRMENLNNDKMDIFNDKEEIGSGRVSSFEKSQIALKSQIAALESENIESAKPWSLRGEINARQRPSDSLLEESVDFDNLSRPVPQITESRSEEIEDIIKRRIGEGAWDDVERKDGRDLTLINGMNVKEQKSSRALLEDVANSGPKRSLTQVYEDEASTKITGNSALDEETREKQSELTALFAKICRHVDGLSGNRFAPKVYVQSDFQIKTLGAGKK